MSFTILFDMSIILACLAFLQFIVLTYGTTGEQKDFFIKAHNDLRRAIALGKTPNQPAAADMEEVVWDDLLAEKAEFWAGQCIPGHDTYDDRKVPKYEYVGQNMYAGPDINEVVQGWYDEYKDYDYSSKNCGGVCGHYTQVAWSKSNVIGCAAVDCEKKSSDFPYGWLYICNYGPAGNFNDEAPYESGPACSKCPAGTSCKNSLCSAGKRRRKRDEYDADEFTFAGGIATK